MQSPDRVAQEIRLRRFCAAALTSVLFAALACMANALGLMRDGSLVITLFLVALCVMGFFLFIRSGWNESLADPSVTLPMILASSSVNTYVLHSLQAGHGAFLLFYMVSMLFGVFRLRRRELLAVAGFIITSHALVVWRLGVEQPDLPLAAHWMQWIVLSCVLIWFANMGSYIGKLIHRLGQAELDELTGAYSRRRILEILRHEKLRAERTGGQLSICLLDIDRLKSVNDTHGHQGGDHHLKQVVAAVQQELRGIDYVGRVGGDEFLVVPSETSLPGARECAERMRRTLRRLSTAETPARPPATLSIGIAEYAKGETIMQTMGRADAALYAAKARGRDRIECASEGEGTIQPG